MPSSAVRPIGYEDRLSIVDHLDELRSRLMICIAAFVVCFSFAYWQNDNILELVNKPFTESQRLDENNPAAEGGDALEQSARFNDSIKTALGDVGLALKAQEDVIEALARGDGISAGVAKELRESNATTRGALTAIQASAAKLPDATPKPVTLGVTEPFLATFTVSSYAALLLALPLVLYQLYAFLLPAFSPQEKKTAVPFMVMVPILFLCGVAFGYYVALPRAVDFLLNFNDDNFDILVGARDYYKFSILLLLVVGLLFQVPVGVLAITRLGIVTPQQLSKNRGYIILGVAVIAAVATPTPDPITMLITMLPLVVLFEASLILARIFQKRAAGRPSRWDWDDDDEDPGDDDPNPEDDDPYGFHDDAGPDDDPSGDGEDPGDAVRGPRDSDAVVAGSRAELTDSPGASSGSGAGADPDRGSGGGTSPRVERDL